MYAHALDRVVRSTDGGDTWKVVCQLPEEVRWLPLVYAVVRFRLMNWRRNWKDEVLLLLP